MSLRVKLRTIEQHLEFVEHVSALLRKEKRGVERKIRQHRSALFKSGKMKTIVKKRRARKPAKRKVVRQKRHHSHKRAA